MSERIKHPEWDNPYIVADGDEAVISLIRSIRRAKAAAEQPEIQTAEDEN